MELILQYPLILVSLVLVVMVGLAYIIVKPRKKTQKKEDKKQESETKQTTDEKPDETKVETSETKETEEKKKKKKLKRLKPEITHVYEKKKLKSKEEEKKEEDLSPLEEEFLKRMQFVKTSKNISKLKPYTAKEEIVEEHVEELSMPEHEEECVFCEENHKSSYFDRSRRLSKMIKDGTLDDMFCSHISEKYMHMDDISRHIRNCDEIEEKLFERAAKTMANSESKISITEDGKVKNSPNKDDVKSYVEERRRQELAKYVTSNNEENQIDDYDYEDIVYDDVDLSARNVLVVDSILNRKGKTKPKK